MQFWNVNCFFSEPGQFTLTPNDSLRTLYTKLWSSFNSLQNRSNVLSGWERNALSVDLSKPGVNSIKKYKCILQVEPLFLHIRTNFNPLKVFVNKFPLEASSLYSIGFNQFLAENLHAHFAVVKDYWGLLVSLLNWPLYLRLPLNMFSLATPQAVQA